MIMQIAAQLSFSGILKLLLKSSFTKIITALVYNANTTAIQPNNKLSSVKRLGIIPLTPNGELPTVPIEENEAFKSSGVLSALSAI